MLSQLIQLGRRWTVVDTAIVSFLGLFLGASLIAACTPAQLSVVKSISDLAGEVCVERDSTEVCLSKCAAASASAAPVSSSAP